MVFGLLLLGGAAAVLWFGAELFVENSASAGRWLGTTGLAVGLLLAGAEPEELVTAVIAAVRGRGGIAAGDAIGANITMLTVVFGLAVLMQPLPVSGRVRRYLFGAAAFGAIAAALMPNGVNRGEGAVLVLLYVAAVTAIWRTEKRPPPIGELAELEEEGSAGAQGSGAVSLVLAIAGIGLMSLGGWLAVSGAERVIEVLDVADSVIGLTMVALATTAELFAIAVAAQRRGVTELAVAGIVGSTGYNATVTLGGAALARPIATEGIVGAAWFAAALPLFLVFLGGKRGSVPRWAGLALLIAYGSYVLVVFA